MAETRRPRRTPDPDLRDLHATVVQIREMVQALRQTLTEAGLIVDASLDWRGRVSGTARLPR